LHSKLEHLYEHLVLRPQFQSLCKLGEVDIVDLASVASIPPIFEESSCQLYLLHEKKGAKYIVKWVDGHPDTPFWSMMLGLFSLTLPKCMLEAPMTYPFIRQHQSLRVPELKASIADESSGMVLLQYISGEQTDHKNVTHEMVEGLAWNLAGLHGHCFGGFGSISSQLTLDAVQAEDSVEVLNQWRCSLMETLNELTAYWTQFEWDLSQVEAQINHLTVSRFVPLMTDLRWDQFAHQTGALSAIFDLDAYVVAPIEWDFVMLEYLLSPAQIETFKGVYLASGEREIPDLSECRLTYRTLLFLINALGEDDLTLWMSRPHYF